MAKLMAKKKTARTSLNLIPVAGHILIEPFEAETVTEAGIYLPDSAQTEKPQKGKVLAVGEALMTDFGIKKDSPTNVGETILYKKWGGNEVKINGKEYLFVKFEDVLAIEQ